MLITSALLVLFCTATALPQLPAIRVQAGAYTRVNSLVEVTLQKPLLPGSAYQIRNTVTGREAAVQYEGRKILFVLPDTLQPGQQALYKIEKAAAAKPAVAVQQRAGGLLVTVNGKELLLYHTAVAQPPADSPAYYARSGFIHPLYSPAGNVLTDDFPAGHAHQHGIMMAWVNTRYKNQSADFWNQQSQRGNVRHAAVLSVTQGPVAAQIKLQLQHITKQQEEVLSEVWTITVYPFSNYFLFDMASSQLNTSADTLHINQYHYGGMSFRGSPQWNPDDKINYASPWKIETDSGFTVATGNGRHAAYVAAEGMVNNKKSGVVVFGFPDNFRYPQALRIHPTMPYWCYAPMVDGAFTINPQQTFASRYRYCVYDGGMDKQLVQRLLHDLQQPPVAAQLETTQLQQ